MNELECVYERMCVCVHECVCTCACMCVIKTKQEQWPESTVWIIWNKCTSKTTNTTHGKQQTTWIKTKTKQNENLTLTSERSQWGQCRWSSRRWAVHPLLRRSCCRWWRCRRGPRRWCGAACTPRPRRMTCRSAAWRRSSAAPPVCPSVGVGK